MNSYSFRQEKDMEVDISRGGLKSFLADIAQFPETYKLTLHLRLRKRFRQEEFPIAVNILKKLHNVKVLCIYGDRPRSSTSGFEELCEGIVQGSYHELVLANVFMDKSLCIFSERLTNCEYKSLRSFDYSDSGDFHYSSSSRRKLALALKTMPHLESVEIFGGIVGYGASEFLDEMVPGSKLRHLGFLCSDIHLVEKLRHTTISSVAIKGISYRLLDDCEDGSDVETYQLRVPLWIVNQFPPFLYDKISKVLEENTILTEFSPLIKTYPGNKRLRKLLKRNRILSTSWSPSVYFRLPLRLQSHVLNIIRFSYSSGILTMLPREVLYVIFYYLQ